jgi:hypothetical protein
MLKPFTLSLSLALALGLCGVSKAGLHNKLASGQSPCASEQCPAPSSQCAKPSAQCPPKKSCLSGLFQHKPKTYCYEWVLKKKKCHGGGCDVCGTPICASGQASPQAYGAYGSGQVYGAGQSSMSGPAPMSGDEAPPAPAAPTDGAAPTDAPMTPSPVTPPAANATGSLLFLAPAGN